MAKKYIEREEVIDALCFFDERSPIGRTAREVVKNIPAADVRPVVRGKWIDEPIKGIWYHCSVCQGRFDYTWRYCPNCGAWMEES